MKKKIDKKLKINFKIYNFFQMKNEESQIFQVENLLNHTV
jgi:hypothetical protein